VFPPKACPDISAVLSSVTPYPPISHPVLDRVARNIGKVEPAWTGRLTPAILQAHGSFLRRMWITFVRKELGPLSFSRPRWYLTGAVDQVRALRAFWPQAKIHLLVPDDESLTALRDAGVPVEVFGTVYRWRHGGDLVRLLKTLGVDRAGRRSLHGRLPELRRLFYPV
jgi:hypothetical protein